MVILNEYYEALNRLIQNKPINVHKGTKINNDTVALEAGRKRGSIKKSRPLFLELIESIKEASEEKNFPEKRYKERIKKLTTKINDYKLLYENVLNRELMLIEKVKYLENEIKKNSSNKLNIANNI
jgi:hypothetical protein